MSNPRLDAAYVAQVKAVKTRVELYAATRFKAGQYRDADLERFIKQVVPVALAGRQQVANLTDLYLTQTLFAAGIAVPRRRPVDTRNLRGVDASEVYARPFVTVRTKLAEGKAFDAAVNAGAARLTDIVLTDLQLAKTHSARDVMQSTARISVFMRVLNGGNNCALCYVASTNRYFVEDLLPIHPGCDCGVEPIIRAGETVQSGGTPAIDPNRLAATHEAVEDRLGVSDSGARAPDYRKQIIVQEHGEIGPVLTVKGQHFQGRSVMDK